MRRAVRQARVIDCNANYTNGRWSLIPVVDFDLLHGAASTPEEDAHCVGSAVKRGFDEGSVLTQCGFKFFKHARVARWVDHISQRSSTVGKHVGDHEHVIIRSVIT